MKKLIPLALALLLILASCSAGDAAPSPLPTAPLKVWDEANPVAVTISTRELTGEAKEIFDAMSSALSGETLLLNYESGGAQAVQVRVYELLGGVWELLSPAAAYALPDEDGSLALTLEPCFASGWALGIFDGSGGRWEGEAGPDISDCYTCITVGGEAHDCGETSPSPYRCTTSSTPKPTPARSSLWTSPTFSTPPHSWSTTPSMPSPWPSRANPTPAT